MHILALGGTKFVGRAFIEAASARGHRVTVLHRGKTPLPDLPGVDEILADRDGGLAALGDGTWDAVYDSCGYVPRVVRQSTEALADRCGRYLFISSISVFDQELKVRRPETPLTTEEINEDTYGVLKVECEDVVTAAFGSGATLVRPGLVAGANDPTGRFPYWVDRFARFGEVLVPDIPGAPLQQIDARDLGAFCVRLLEDDRAGAIEAAGEKSSFEAMINLCAAQGGGVAVKVPLEFFEANGVHPGADLPLVFDVGEPLLNFDSEEALAAGLERRSLRETAADTLAWLLTFGEEPPISGRLPRATEETLIASARS